MRKILRHFGRQSSGGTCEQSTAQPDEGWSADSGDKIGMLELTWHTTKPAPGGRAAQQQSLQIRGSLGPPFFLSLSSCLSFKRGRVSGSRCHQATPIGKTTVCHDKNADTRTRTLVCQYPRAAAKHGRMVSSLRRMSTENPGVVPLRDVHLSLNLRCERVILPNVGFPRASLAWDVGGGRHMLPAAQ